MRVKDHLRPSIEFLCPLRGVKLDSREQRAIEDDESVAGLRRSVSAVRKLPSVQQVGLLVCQVLSALLDADPQLERTCVGLLANGVGVAPPPGLTETQASYVRSALGRAFSIEDPSPSTSATCTASVVGQPPAQMGDSRQGS